ncbi:hypothetical protein U1Q18_013510, partial [Sarracenia purpurea var. burkii]
VPPPHAHPCFSEYSWISSTPPPHRSPHLTSLPTAQRPNFAAVAAPLPHLLLPPPPSPPPSSIAADRDL